MGDMNTELKEILEMMTHLKAMEGSLIDYATKLKLKKDEFLIKYLGFEKDQSNISPFEMISRALDK